MFKFYGSLNEQIINKSDKKKMKSIAPICIIIDIIALLVDLILFFVYKEFFAEMTALTIVLMLTSIMFLCTKPRSLTFKLPRLIIFDLKSQTITKQIEGINKKPHVIKLSKIKNIYDYGDWYYCGIVAVC